MPRLARRSLAGILKKLVFVTNGIFPVTDRQGMGS